MAEPHPDIQELLAVLFEGPAAPLAQMVADRIRADDEAEDEGDGEEERLIRRREPPRAEAERERGYRQLDLAHRTITEHLKRRILISGRLRALAPGLEVEGVVVVPDAGALLGEDAEDAPRREGPRIDLLDERRDAAAHAFLETWNDVQNELRRRWEVSGGQ